MLSFVRLRLQYRVAERAAFAADKAALFRLRMVASLREAGCPIGSGPFPFVFMPPQDERTWYFTAETWTAYLILVGPAIEHAAMYIDGLARQSWRGLGRGRTRVLLEQVDMLDPRDHGYQSYFFVKEQQVKTRLVPFTWDHVLVRARLLAGRERLTLVLQSPLRLPRDAERSGSGLLTCLRDRLARFGAPTPPFEGIRCQEEALRWEGSRASGRLVLEGDLDPLFPALVAGQHLNLGLGAAFGWGRYTLTA